MFLPLFSLNKMKKKNIIPTVVFILIGATCFLYPAVSNLINNIFNDSKINEYNTNTDTMTNAEINDIYKKAQEYNKAVSMDYYTDNKAYEEILSQYNDIMNFGDGLIGYIEIPKISVKLPVYHGESEEVLKKGAAHLEQTSFPIGGVNTHACISAHSGYPTQKFFDDLDELKTGDMIYIHILAQTLTYKVYKTDIVKPSDTEQLNIVNDKDILTLITCTPYGINSHRLLVHAERTLDSDKQQISIENEKEGNNNFVVTALLICFIFFSVGLILIIYIINRHKLKSKAGEL